MVSVAVVCCRLNESMDCFGGVDLFPSLRRSLSSTDVAGCSKSSSVEMPLRRGACARDEHRGRRRGSVELLYHRREVRMVAVGAMGRIGGAVHGSNTRKTSRRHPARPEFEDDQDCSKPESGNEIVHDASAEDPENFGFCSYESEDRASGFEIERSNRQDFDVDIHVYDDIHGDFWPNNPYFQEMEGSQGKNTAYEQSVNESTVEKYFVQIDDVRAKAANKHVNASVNNGVITNPEAITLNPLQDAASVTQDESSEPLQIQKEWEGSENSIPTSSDDIIRMADADRFAIYSVKDKKESSESIIEKSKILHIDRGKGNFMARETKNAERPADILGSLESVGSTQIQDRKSFGNTDLDSGFSRSPYVPECRRDGKTLTCDEVGIVSSDDSVIPENDFNNTEKLSLQNKAAFFEGIPEHQSVNFHRLPPGPLATSEDMSTAFLSVLASGLVEGPADDHLPEKVNGPVLQLINEMALGIQQVEDIPTQVVEQTCPSKQDFDNEASFSTSGTVSLFPSEAVEEGAELTLQEHVEQILNDMENIPSQVSHAAEQAVSNLVDQVTDQVSQAAEQVVSTLVDQVTEVLSDPVVEQVSLAAEQIVEQVASHVVEPFANKASEIASFLSADDEESEDSDDEFEAYKSSDSPEFKGIQGLDNFTVLQEDHSVFSALYDFYTIMLKKPLPEFVLGMFSAPVLLSVIFTLLYLPEFSGLALDETARNFFGSSGVNVEEGQSGLQLSWVTVFQVFMFSVSLSTGLQPELSPLSPYTLVIANLNALIAQLIFVFLSGAVFARLSQPSQPVRCSTVALICPPPSIRRIRKETSYKVLLARYVLVGPQPSELVDVKVDFTYKYNSVTRSGSYFRMTQTLKLVRPEIAYLTHGMLVRHIIDETSPLYRRNHEMLVKEDAVFSLSVVGLERSSMQSVFYVQHYCVYDGDVIWDAEFEDMILINQKNRRVVDHSALSKWRPVRSE